ncbi:MAG: radical SAM family heme chaperone HemW [Candidatus Sumerlaeaceae bacterium]|nr:radical SAM family heme chaperone HemW [Candidatus Sumerlaeaceae bacterium]
MVSSFYIHVPFCEARCPYCDFFTLGKGTDGARLASGWLTVVAHELELWIAAGDVVASEPVRTLYLGGGTPSLASAEAVDAFVKTFRSLMSFAADAEVTIELQPGTVDQRKLEGYALAGINRFSVGAQTFSPARLKLLERRHSVEDTVKLIRDVKNVGRLSIDLIAALPEQTLKEWQADLETAVSFDPEHLSVYELTYYHGTALASRLHEGSLRQVDEELRVEIFEWTVATLTEAGYEHYEISNFAKPGCRSRHNENYWRLGDYVGLGAGAHSFVFPHRYANPPDVEAYSAAISADKLARRLIDPHDQDVFYLENLFMGLRLLDGVDIEDFRTRFGVGILDHFASRLAPLFEEGLLELHGNRLRLTREGIVRADAVISYLA